MLLRTISRSLVMLLSLCIVPGLSAPAQTAKDAAAPRVRLLFTTVGEKEGEVRLRDLPHGDEWTLWRWQLHGRGYFARVRIVPSPDLRRVLILEERMLCDPNPQKPCHNEYIFALADLWAPEDSARPLPSPAFIVVVHYPVWLDSSAFVVGVSGKDGSKQGYQQMLWRVDPPTPPRKMAEQDYFTRRKARQLAATRVALNDMPAELLPAEIREHVAKSQAIAGLNLRELQRLVDQYPAMPEAKDEDAALALARLDMLQDESDTPLGPEALRIRLAYSRVSLSPSGKRMAVTDGGDKLITFDPASRQSQRVSPLELLVAEQTVLSDLHWSPDEQWLLFTETHYQGSSRAGRAPRTAWSPVVAFVRALNTESGEVVTLVAGQNGFWMGEPFTDLP